MRGKNAYFTKLRYFIYSQEKILFPAWCRSFHGHSCGLNVLQFQSYVCVELWCWKPTKEKIYLLIYVNEATKIEAGIRYIEWNAGRYGKNGKNADFEFLQKCVFVYRFHALHGKNNLYNH